MLQRSVVEIAEDETRHAALAWRTRSWLLDAHPELRAVADEALADATAPSPAPARVEAPDLGHGDFEDRDLEHRDIEQHGCLGPASRERVRRVGLDHIVLPLARELAESSRNACLPGGSLPLWLQEV